MKAGEAVGIGAAVLETILALAGQQGTADKIAGTLDALKAVGLEDAIDRLVAERIGSINGLTVRVVD